MGKAADLVTKTLNKLSIDPDISIESSKSFGGSRSTLGALFVSGPED